MKLIRSLFTPSAGSRARNIARAVLPALVLLEVVHLSGVQVAAVVIAVEAVFSGGAEITTRTNKEIP